MQVMIEGKYARLAFELGRKVESDEDEDTWVTLDTDSFDVVECTDCGDDDCTGYTAEPKAKFGFRAA